MFGEYIPLAEYIPWLYKITPLTGGLTTGTKAVAQKLGNVRYARRLLRDSNSTFNSSPGAPAA